MIGLLLEIVAGMWLNKSPSEKFDYVEMRAKKMSN